MENNCFKRLLLVDDYVYIVELLSLILTRSDYQIISASNGKDAIAILSGQPIDMIVVDLMIPEMDGLAFLHWLRQEEKATMPELVLTGRATPDTEKQVLSAGATALLYKPIKVADLLTKIHQLEQLI